MSITYTHAAHGDNGKSAQDSCRTDDPRETQEEDDTQDVLHAGQVHPNECSHLGALGMDKDTYSHRWDTRRDVSIETQKHATN